MGTAAKKFLTSEAAEDVGEFLGHFMKDSHERSKSTLGILGLETNGMSKQPSSRTL